MNNRNLTSILLTAGLLVGCGDPNDEDFGYAEGGVPTHAPDELDSPEPTDNDEDGDDASPGLEHAPGQLGDVQPSDPGGRITGMAEEDGDLIVYATVGADVVALYPSAHAYRIRFDLDGEATVLYTELLDVEGVVLERMRNRDAASSYFQDTRAVEFCFPGPWIGFPDNCTVPPCPWEVEPTPWNCIQITGDDQLTQIRGELDGQAFARDVYQNGDEIEVIDLGGGSLDELQLARLDAMGVVMDDIDSILPEVEPVGGECAACIGSGVIGAKGAVDCISGSLLGCGLAGASLWLLTNACGSAC